MSAFVAEAIAFFAALFFTTGIVGPSTQFGTVHLLIHKTTSASNLKIEMIYIANSWKSNNINLSLFIWIVYRQIFVRSSRSCIHWSITWQQIVLWIIRKIQEQHMLKCTQIGFCFDIQNNLCTQQVLNLYFSCNSMNNLLS